MPEFCSALGCSVERNAQSKEQGISFHRYPRDQVIRDAWILAVRRRENVTNDRAVVCSRHFNPEDFEKTGQKIRLREGVIPLHSRHPTTAAAESPIDVDVQLSEALPKSTTESETNGRSVPNSTGPNEIYVQGYGGNPLKRTWGEVETDLPYGDHDYYQRYPPLEEQLQEAHKTIACQEEELVKLRKNRFFLKRFQCDDRLIMFYTGFKDYVTLMAVFMALQPTAENTVGLSQKQAELHAMHSLPLIDQFFLFLCRLRQGFLLQDLAARFNVSQTIVSKICVTWTNFLYYMLGSVLVWPSRVMVNKCMPSSLKNTFPNTRVILDCTELHVQRASPEALNLETYSDNRGATTLKSLVGISPSGELTFVSDLYRGSISDREITKSSGILSLLEEGDEVMADKNFHISELLSALNVSLAVPPSLKSNRQPTQKEVLQTQEISRLKNSVEQAIGRIKEYHILDGKLPMTTMGSINQVWKVCALLTAFQGPL